jgi:CheY-like chemotaxis protein
MVHGLAEQLGGRLTLTSALGIGTTARIWLPAAEGDATVAAPVAAPAAPPPATPAATLAPLTILAVDDDGLVLMNTAAMLEDLGHRVIESNSGLRALQLLETEPHIDLIITDQAMPQMTGLQFAEQVRAQRPAIPIIIATGYAELPPGPTDFIKLDKPFFERQLIAAVSTAMQGRPA